MEAPQADLRLDGLPRPDLDTACSSLAATSEESAVTVDRSGMSLVGDASSSPPSMEWTDEKHHRFLNLLERSFVDQLNHSKRSHGATLPEVNMHLYPSTPAGLPVENDSSIDEVKQGGCRQQINFQRMQNTSYSCAVKSPRDLDDGTSVQHSAHHVCHRSPVNGTSVYAEVSDQNFAARGKGSAYSSVPKRSRRNSPAGSSNDQVVPSGEIYKALRSLCRYPASSEKRSGLLKLLSEDHG